MIAKNIAPGQFGGAEMGRSCVRSNVFVIVSVVVFGLAMICLAGVAGLMNGLGPHALQARSFGDDSQHEESQREESWRAALLNADPADASEPTPAAVIEQRFVWDRADEPARALPQAATNLMTADTGNVLPIPEMTLFSRSLAYPAAASIGETPAAAVPEPATAAVAAVAAAPSPAPAQNADPASRRRVAARFSNVLNDAQIASIKKRLKLTPDQEQMWPAVEAALRRIAYKTAAAARHRPVASDVADAGRQHTGLMAYIDPDSAEVQQLKYAAIPLIMRLNDEQRREVKSLAHVMGLESVASEF
jgi:hypothetical protein